MLSEVPAVFAILRKIGRQLLSDLEGATISLFRFVGTAGPRCTFPRVDEGFEKYLPVFGAIGVLGDQWLKNSNEPSQYFLCLRILALLNL